MAHKIILNMENLLNKLESKEIKELSSKINQVQKSFFGNSLSNSKQEKFMAEVFGVKNYNTLIGMKKDKISFTKDNKKNQEILDLLKIDNAEDAFIVLSYVNHQFHEDTRKRVISGQHSISIQEAYDCVKEKSKWAEAVYHLYHQTDIYKSLSKEASEFSKFFNIDIKTIQANINMPDYLLTPSEKQHGCHQIKLLSRLSIADINLKYDYSMLSIDFTPLDGIDIGNGYSIILPKTIKEVAKGAQLLANCMEAQAKHCWNAMSANNGSAFYLDAHIVKDGQLVGVLALDRFLNIKNNTIFIDHNYGCFVNYANSSNISMDKLLFKIVNEKLSLKLSDPDYTSIEFSSRPVEPCPDYVAWK